MGSWHPFGFWMIFGSLLFWLAGGTECLMISLLWNIVLPGILHDARVNKAISVIALAAILGDLENYEVFKTQRTLKVVVGESKRFFKIWKRLTPPLALVHVLYSFTPLQKLCIYCACVCIYNCIYIYIMQGGRNNTFQFVSKKTPHISGSVTVSILLFSKPPTDETSRRRCFGLYIPNQKKAPRCLPCGTPWCSMFLSQSHRCFSMCELQGEGQELLLSPCGVTLSGRC